MATTYPIPRKILVKLSDGRETLYFDTLFNFLTNCDNVDLIIDNETGEILYIREENYIAPDYITIKEN